MKYLTESHRIEILMMIGYGDRCRKQFEVVQLVPAVLYPDAQDPDIPPNTLWIQQDGAPAHYSLCVRQYLNQVFQNRWIERREFIEWPARLPDLTSLDFFLWGLFKE
jgi:hypothetical protein